MNIENPKIKVDHRDHNGLNNCRSNLRIATHSQNMANRRPNKNSTSNYHGVSWHKASQRWTAQIQKEMCKVYLGCFKNEQDAAIAYNTKAVELFGEFANLNKIVI